MLAVSCCIGSIPGTYAVMSSMNLCTLPPEHLIIENWIRLETVLGFWLLPQWDQHVVNWLNIDRSEMDRVSYWPTGHSRYRIHIMCSVTFTYHSVIHSECFLLQFQTELTSPGLVFFMYFRLLNWFWRISCTYWCSIHITHVEKERYIIQWINYYLSAACVRLEVFLIRRPNTSSYWFGVFLVMKSRGSTSWVSLVLQ